MVNPASNAFRFMSSSGPDRSASCQIQTENLVYFRHDPEHFCLLSSGSVDSRVIILIISSYTRVVTGKKIG